MSGHTAGPWVVSNTGIWGGARHDLVVAFAPMVGVMSEADARLVSAAPDLLEAAREVEQTITYLSDPSAVAMHECLEALREVVREAIAKATGDA